ncbi:palmitoyltransferase zdhhc16 [Anaeramoeba flamelloides]|uniref:Palmitoyltransferase n=1 Tax=Anaeramoeba flamelloides TaxID=1746091 RepID=A0ABQ8XRT4_9EUKA|nr:palmitoyltransferase zdhhc16 [Anaeramoeba flamelloides]
MNYTEIMSYVFTILFRVFGFLLVLVVYILIAFVGWVYFKTILPSKFHQNPFLLVFEVAFFIWILTAIIITFTKSAFVRGGAVPYDLLENEEKNEISKEKVNTDPITTIINQDNLELPSLSNYTWCSHCNKVKPPRCHHDSITHQCVLRMDHFCPWLNNTIGYFNHKFFILFLIYLFLGCSYLAIITLKPFLIDLNIVSEDNDVDGTLVIVFIISISSLAGVGFLSVWQLYLLFTNQTTIEFYINHTLKSIAKQRGIKFRNIFNIGKKENFKQFFDLHDKYWFAFLWSFGKKEGDGLHFPTIDTEIDLPIISFEEDNLNI